MTSWRAGCVERRTSGSEGGLRKRATSKDWNRAAGRPHCDRPATWCDAHHLKSWLLGGPTNVDNLILLCRRHHLRVHEHGWSLHLDHHTGIVTAQTPDGRPLDIVSHPRAHSP
jgi:hypothetical protein